MYKCIAIVSIIVWLAVPTAAQNEGHDMHIVMDEMSDMMTPNSEHEISSNPIGLPHARTGSGTAWQPDSTPMYAIMKKSRQMGPYVPRRCPHRLRSAERTAGR